MFARRPPSNQSDLVEHASRLGITLKSSGYMRHRVPSAASATSLTSASTISQQSLPSTFGRKSPAVTYIHDVVVKLGDSEHQRIPLSPAQWRTRRSHFSEPNQRQPLKSSRGNLSSASELRIMSSLGPERLMSDRPMTSLSKPWNLSEQNLRFEAEKVSKIENRTRKRISEISSHRVDRMYYMCGNSLSLSQKYSVDPMEFVRLQQLTATSRGGKGFNPNDRTLPGDVYNANVDDDEKKHSKKGKKKTKKKKVKDVPRQPPPSSLSQTAPVITEDTGDAAARSDVDSVSEEADFIDQPQKTEVEDEKGKRKDELKEESNLKIVGESKNMSSRGKESEEKGEENGRD